MPKPATRSLSGKTRLLRKKGSGHSAALLAALFAANLMPAWAQDSTSVPQSRSPTTLGDSMKHPGNKQVHIFYVHGMAADGPGYSESQDLRKSICKLLKDCTWPEGHFAGREYANQHDFALNASPPPLSYLNQPIWTSRKGSTNPSEGWNASAPFVDHWEFLRKDNATTIYLDEINWWPLVFAVKCRQIVAKDAELVGPGKAFIEKCSSLEPDQADGRFISYPWIEPDNAQHLESMPAKGARINRSAKNAVLDWGFTDAVLAVGPLRPYLLEGIRELVLKSADVAVDGSRGSLTGPLPNQEFFFVSHSLGSYLIFSAMEFDGSQTDSASSQDWRVRYENVLSQTSTVYFLANQLRLLELANLDVSAGVNMMDHLKKWGQLRHDYLLSLGPATPDDLKPALIVAWSDPSDLLSWTVPDLTDTSNVSVENLIVKNALHWFWLIENPASAHANYATNHRVIEAIIKPKKPSQQQ
jgi:hypothetical protein